MTMCLATLYASLSPLVASAVRQVQLSSLHFHWADENISNAINLGCHLQMSGDKFAESFKPNAQNMGTSWLSTFLFPFSFDQGLGTGAKMGFNRLWIEIFRHPSLRGNWTADYPVSETGTELTTLPEAPPEMKPAPKPWSWFMMPLFLWIIIQTDTPMQAFMISTFSPIYCDDETKTILMSGFKNLLFFEEMLCFRLETFQLKTLNIMLRSWIFRWIILWYFTS